MIRRIKIKAENLRQGDEIQAADGISWLDPVRSVEVGSDRYHVVQAWIKRPLSGLPDHEFLRSQTLRIRRGHHD